MKWRSRLFTNVLAGFLRVPLGPPWFETFDFDFLSVRPTALLIFLPRAARTRIVAPDFRGAAHDLLHGLQISRTSHAGLLQFAALFALESFLNFVH